jgi:DnaJ-class molecular chaperone
MMPLYAGQSSGKPDHDLRTFACSRCRHDEQRSFNLIRNTMTDKLPAPCEHCGATGIFHGIECDECRGKGYRLMVDGRTAPIRAARPVRPPHRTFQRDKA